MASTEILNNQPTAATSQSTSEIAQQETPVDTQQQQTPAQDTSSADHQKETPKDLKLKYSGIVLKKALLPGFWQKRYFVLQDKNFSYQINQLRLVYNKNIKKTNAPAKEFEKANTCLLDTLATATVNSRYMISYFKNETKDISNNTTPHGLINFKQVLSVEPVPKFKTNAFVVKTKARDYIFNTKSTKETEEWINTIKHMLNSDIPSFEDTEAYKNTMKVLLARNAFIGTKPSADQEVFSASETELEQAVQNKEATPEKETDIPTEEKKEQGTDVEVKETSEVQEAPETEKPQEIESEAAVAAPPAPASNEKRKSYYKDVVGAFFKKGDKHENAEKSEAENKETVQTEEPQVAEQEVAVKEETSEVKPEAEEKIDTEVKEIEANVSDIKDEEPVKEEDEKDKKRASVTAKNKKSFGLNLFNKEKDGPFLKKFFKKGESQEQKEATETQEQPQEVPVTEEVTQLVEEPKEEKVEIQEPKPEEVEVENTDKTEENSKAPVRKQTIMQRIGGLAKGASNAEREKALNERIENSVISGDLNKQSRIYKAVQTFCILSKDGKFIYCKSKQDQGKIIDLKADVMYFRIFTNNTNDFEFVTKYRSYKFTALENGENWISNIKEFVNETKEESIKPQEPAPKQEEPTKEEIEETPKETVEATEQIEKQEPVSEVKEAENTEPKKVEEVTLEDK